LHEYEYDIGTDTTFR